MSIHNESNVLFVSTITHTSILQKYHQPVAVVVDFIKNPFYTINFNILFFFNSTMFVRCGSRMYFTFDLNAKHFCIEFLSQLS